MITERKKFSIQAIETKTYNNFVSYVDKTSEQLFIEGLTQLLPESGIIGEEAIGNRNGEHYNWIIDPLDGTTNYLHNIPIFCTSVALQVENEIVIGVVYDPNRDECFYAVKNHPAYLNGEPISVSSCDNLSNSLIATGFPYDDFGKKAAYLNTLSTLFGQTRGIRRLGAAALDLAYVACGRFDAFYEYALSPWDVAAGSLIVQQAGGQVTEFNGNSNFLFGDDILAGNANIHKELKQVLNKHF